MALLSELSDRIAATEGVDRSEIDHENQKYIQIHAEQAVQEAVKLEAGEKWETGHFSLDIDSNNLGPEV